MNKPLKHESTHTGSTFESFLKEEGILEEVQGAALKRLAEISAAIPTKETFAATTSGIADSESQ